jgi:AhpD family alkylhydroperoxidase
VESQSEQEKNRVNQVKRLTELLPDVMAASRGMASEVYQDRALSGKIKRLMALAIALGTGCSNCQLAQTMYALEGGATRDEILETISVVLSMRGTTGAGESLRVVQFLDEMGKL